MSRERDRTGRQTERGTDGLTPPDADEHPLPEFIG